MLKVMQQIGRTRLTLLVAILVSCSMFVLDSAPAYAHTSKPAYSCGDDQSGHCYGVVSWFGPNNSHLGGVQTDIVVQQIYCAYPPGSQCQGLGLNNEVWMADTASSQVKYCNNAACWVEVGYQGGTDACGFDAYNFQCYFWADNRPNGGYYNHWNTLPSDNYGHHTRMKIKWLGNGSWDVSVNPLASSDGYWDSTSTSNTIYPQYEELGSELIGSSSSGYYLWVNTTDWTNNEWADANVNFHYQGSCGSNCTAGSIGGAPPPYSQWGSVPNCCNNGGDWQVWAPQNS